MGRLTEFESQILFWIQNNVRTGGMLDRIMPFVSTLNDNGLGATFIVVFFVLFYKRYRTVGLVMMVSLVSEFTIVSIILKPLVHRVRPYNEPENIERGFTALDSLMDPGKNSFPSGHTGTIFAVATVMLLCMIKYNFSKIITLTVVFLAFLIAFSRLYNGAHYPTDVLAAMCIGITTGTLSVRFAYAPAQAVSLKLENMKKNAD